MRLQTSTVAFQVTYIIAVALRVLPKSKFFLYNVTIQRSRYPPACNEAIIYLSTTENAVQKKPS